MVDIKNVVADNVRFYRALKGWSSEKLSAKSGISVVTISNIENKKISDPKLSTIVAFADAFEVPIEKLLKEEWTEEDIEDEEYRLNQVAYRDMMDVLYPEDKKLKEKVDSNYVSCLLEFLVYLPLIDIKDMHDCYLNNVNGVFVGFEEYIVYQQIGRLIKDIPDSKAKQYAAITVEAIRKARVSRERDSADSYLYENSDGDGLREYNLNVEKRLDMLQHLYRVKQILCEEEYDNRFRLK